MLHFSLRYPFWVCATSDKLKNLLDFIFVGAKFQLFYCQAYNNFATIFCFNIFRTILNIMFLWIFETVLNTFQYFFNISLNIFKRR